MQGSSLKCYLRINSLTCICKDYATFYRKLSPEELSITASVSAPTYFFFYKRRASIKLMPNILKTSKKRVFFNNKEFNAINGPHSKSSSLKMVCVLRLLLQYIKFLKGTLRQIWKSAKYLRLHMKVICWKSHINRLLLFEIWAREVCEKFVYKHSETIEC